VKRGLEASSTEPRLSIPVRGCLGSVLPGLANFSINRIAELTPVPWAARAFAWMRRVKRAGRSPLALAHTINAVTV
jgi:hypothetical protein